MIECNKKSCSYYCKSTKTCDYRLIVGEGRGTPVKDCKKYTTAPVGRKNWEGNICDARILDCI